MYRISVDDPIDLSNYLPNDAAYLYGASEERSRICAFKAGKALSTGKIIQIDENRDNHTIHILDNEFSIKYVPKYREVIKFLETENIVIEISGLSNQIWCPIVKLCLEAHKNVTIIYAEPKDYKKKEGRAELSLFDLSEKTEGVNPLPGLASLNAVENEKSVFVPFLGFEGPRLSYLLEVVQPVGDNIIPVVGVPGFQLEYPFFALESNRKPLIDSKAWKRITYIKADCPFEAYELLEKKLNQGPNVTLIKVAPIGTKPHCLGTLLFRLLHPDSCEIIYDNPVIKPERTAGLGRTHVYNISDFFWSKAGANLRYERQGKKELRLR